MKTPFGCNPWARAGAVTLLGIALLTSAPALAASRTRPDPGRVHVAPHPTLNAITVVPSSNPQDLLQCLLGPGVTVSNVRLTAADSASGTFSGGLDILGIGSGIALGSGHIATIVGPNQFDDVTYDNQLPGDADLDALIPGYETFDATILEFDFECISPQVVSFQYVFTSDEYNEFVTSAFNDVFGFFLNGTNIAIVPSGCSDPGIPVAINNVDCGNPFVPLGGPNCNCYRNNDLSDGGPFFDTEMDGLTQVFYATGTIQPGLNHIKIAIADAGDHILDSNVLIACQSFSCEAPPATGACCFPSGSCVTLSYPQCFGQGGNYYGDHVPCDPEPCAEPVGACCMPNGECEVEGANGCALNGGTYQGDGTVCTGGPCSELSAPDRGADEVMVVAIPNPTAGSVVLKYRLPRFSAVSIDVLDASGRLVRRLSDGPRGVGEHSLTWDARNQAGAPVPAGVYLVLTKTQAGVTMRKVILSR